MSDSQPNRPSAALGSLWGLHEGPIRRREADLQITIIDRTESWSNIKTGRVERTFTLRADCLFRTADLLTSYREDVPLF
jgi:hypothetical protein